MNKEFLELIKTRRSVRAYEDKPVPKDLLELVLEAGTYAPTGMGKQSPVIVSVTDKAVRDEISSINAKILGADTDPYYGAPNIILVLTEKDAFTGVEDASCVLENMMLAAHAIGLASVWVHREREIFESDEGKALLKKWGLSDNLKGVGSIALGYAKETPKAAKRKEGYVVSV